MSLHQKNRAKKMYFIEASRPPFKNSYEPFVITKYPYPHKTYSYASATRLYYLQALFYFIYIKIKFPVYKSLRIKKVPLFWWEKDILINNK